MTDPTNNLNSQLPANLQQDHQRADSQSEQQDPLQVLLQASAAAEALQGRFQELQTRQAEVLAEREQLAVERSTFESRATSFADEVAQQRAQLREAAAEIQRQKDQQAELQAKLEGQSEELEVHRDELARKQDHLSETVNQELARERESLQRQQEFLDEERQKFVERNQQLEAEHSARLQQVEQDLKSERETMRDDLRRDLSTEFQQLNRERQEWDEEKEREAQEMQQQADDLQQQREMFGQQLDTEQNRLKEEIEKRRQMLLSEQNNLQRRYRFQFEHLARAREDFELELRELRKEQQLFRTERRSFQEQNQLRFRQLNSLREVLADREASLVREQKVIDRERMGSELEIRRQNERLNEHRDAVMQDLESRHRHVQQLEQASSENANKADQRLQHINQMRSELDTQQRDILEQRLLLEERNSIPMTAGQHTDEDIHQARQAVESFFESLHGRLKIERLRLDDQFRDLKAKQEQFRADRIELERWFAEQEQQVVEADVSNRTDDLYQRIQQLEAEQAESQQTFNQAQKLHESTVRQLLDQIADAQSRQIGRSSETTAAETTAAETAAVAAAPESAANEDQGKAA